MGTKKAGRRSVIFSSPPVLVSYGNCVGKKEGEGPLASCFDYIDGDDSFGQSTWEKAEQAMTNETYVDENGNEVIQPKYTMGDSSGNEIEVYAMTQEQLDQFEDLLSRIDSTVSYNTKILEIIQEDAALFFNGQKSAEETAKTIQSRVSIYVNE